MNLGIKPTTALRFTKISVSLVSSWPPPKFLNKFHKFWFDLRWSIAIILLLFLFFPLINGVYMYRNDTMILVKAICMSSATAQAILKMGICRMERSRLQVLHSQLDNFVRNAQGLEREYIQKYINKICVFHVFVTLSMWLVCLAFIIEPIVLSHKFPTDVAYPFPIDHRIVHAGLYIQQVVALFLIASALTVDFQVATLLWFTGARLEILGHYFSEVTNEMEFIRCVKEHQDILQYGHEVNSAVRFIALGTIATTTIGVICGGITLISNQPISVKLRIGNIVGNATVELFAYSWPADHLIQMSEAIGWSIYNCQWVGKSSSMLKAVLTVIRRTQKPVIIAIDGFIPALSFQYYTSFLATTFSYFTSLRVMLLASESAR